MKNQELFDRTIGILVQAYLKNGIKHGNPCGCAFGNIVLGNNSLIEETSSYAYIFNPYWWFSGVGADWYSDKYGLEIDLRKGKYQIEKTGYSFEDAKLIESAFEDIASPETDTDGYRGLISVCDTLMQIHEATTDEITEAKRLFVKEPA